MSPSSNVHVLKESRPLETTRRYRHSQVVIDPRLGTSTLYMQPPFRPCYTPELLADIRRWQESIRDEIQVAQAEGRAPSVRFGVLASAVPGTFNSGGDLTRFCGWIRDRNRGALLDYATACIDVAYQGSIGLDLGVEFIALVQGDALGGGFEAALATGAIVAERGTKFGFPEVLFNLFPGMGAYSFLSRRVSPVLAERLILSGQLYNAEELHEMGLVSVLAEPGEGEVAVANYIRQSARKRHAHQLINKTRTKFNRVPYAELLEITQDWVECALSLSERDLKVMERLVRRQTQKASVVQ